MHSENWESLGYLRYCPKCKKDVTPEGSFYYETGGDVVESGPSEIRCSDCGKRFESNVPRLLFVLILSLIAFFLIAIVKKS